VPRPSAAYRTTTAEGSESPSDPDIQNPHAGQLLLPPPFLSFFSRCLHPLEGFNKIVHRPNVTLWSGKVHCLSRCLALLFHSPRIPSFSSSVESSFGLFTSARNHGPDPRSRSLRQDIENPAASWVGLLAPNSWQRQRRPQCSLQTLALRR
jgi:hypothetical protein